MRSGTQQWLEIADSDYKISKLLFKHAHHPQAIYAICQAVEKILKAAQIEFKQQPPQKTHQLNTIAQNNGLDFSEEQIEFLKELSKHYRRVRYPDIHQLEYNTKLKVEPLLHEATRLYLWVLNKFKNHSTNS